MRNNNSTNPAIVDNSLASLASSVASGKIFASNSKMVLLFSAVNFFYNPTLTVVMAIEANSISSYSILISSSFFARPKIYKRG